MNIRRLRKDLPDWQWTVERCGMGYVYHGTRGQERVRVYAVAMLCGPTEDDFATQWRADDGSQSRSYAAWWMQQSAARSRGAKP